MIRRQLEDGSYECEASGQIFIIPGKAYYENEKATLLATKQPTDEELIEYAKQFHPFYQISLAVNNIDAQLQEITDFESR